MNIIKISISVSVPPPPSSSLSLAEDDSPGEAKKNCLDSAEFQRILKAKSSHDWIVKEVSVSLS
jgi:hypothetical protein